MVAMWTAMGDCFGGSWVSQFGTSEDPAFDTWAAALSEYTPEQIQRGVNYCADPDHWQSAFPPNLAEFKKLCLTVQFAAPYHKPLEIEHQPKASEVMRKRELARQAHLREYGELPDETRDQSYARLGLTRRWS